MIDVNCDMGEGVPGQEEIMPFLTSVNIACGGHAGDAGTMKETIQQALRWGLRVGAHPGYEDRENFGRTELNLPPDELSHVVYDQCSRFARIADICGAHIYHVKPHGAMYNQAVKNRGIARAIATGVGCWRKDVVLMGLAGSEMLDEFRQAGMRVFAEAFADRRYESDGTLRSRKFPDALIRDPKEAAAQALRIANEGLAETICIHGDTPGAAQIASEVAKALGLPQRRPS
jgi:5-oxoprolinase (ATP-hydrolysing) subunit A